MIFDSVILNTLILTIFPGIMIYAALMDVFTMTIPNRLSLILIASFILLSPFTTLSWSEIGMHVLAGVSMLALTFGMFSMGWIGGGDAKFFAATALWIGFNDTLVMYGLYASFLGGALTIFLLVMNKLPVPVFMMNQKWFVRLHDLKSGVPYGVALAAAGLLVFPSTIWMQAIMAG